MREATWAVDFPRLYELYLDSNTACKANYFANFENVVNYPPARSQYQRLEEDLQQLDSISWQELKKKAIKYVAAKDKHRAYEQLTP